MSRLVLSLALLATTALPASAAEPSERAASAMVTLNSSFITAHKAARVVNLKEGGPVVLLKSGSFVLFRDGKETKVKVIPQAYHTYKTFAHMPAAIDLMLRPLGLGELDEARLDTLRAYRKKMDHVEEAIGSIGFEGAPLARQKTMLKASKVFLDRVIASKRVSSEELRTYTRSMTPFIKANLAGAAKAQIDGMHRQMMIWKKEWTADEWKQLRVCIKGAVFARKNNLAKQYFQKLLGLTGEGPRLAYMELYFPPDPMQTLIATWQIDGGLAMAFFDEPDRMYRDVLSDAATAYLKTFQID